MKRKAVFSVVSSARSRLMGLGFEVLAPPDGSYSGFGSRYLENVCPWPPGGQAPALGFPTLS